MAIIFGGICLREQAAEPCEGDASGSSATTIFVSSAMWYRGQKSLCEVLAPVFRLASLRCQVSLLKIVAFSRLWGRCFSDEKGDHFASALSGCRHGNQALLPAYQFHTHALLLALEGRIWGFDVHGISIQTPNRRSPVAVAWCFCTR